MPDREGRHRFAALQRLAEDRSGGARLFPPDIEFAAQFDETGSRGGNRRRGWAAQRGRGEMLGPATESKPWFFAESAWATFPVATNSQPRARRTGGSEATSGFLGL